MTAAIILIVLAVIHHNAPKRPERTMQEALDGIQQAMDNRLRQQGTARSRIFKGTSYKVTPPRFTRRYRR